MTINPKLTKLWNLKAFILAFQIAFSFCFFIGIFANSLDIKPTHTENRWFYISRGYPVAWAGVTKPNLGVDFPIIKAPFLTKSIGGESYAKIINLSIFIPMFLTVLLISYPITFVFSKATEENKTLNIILYPSYVFLTLASIFFYFFWFPRI